MLTLHARRRPPTAAIVRQWQEPTGPLPNWDHELVEPTAGPQRRLQGQEEQGLDGARDGAGVEAPRGRRLAQATPPEPITITLPRQITSVRTLFVPSERSPAANAASA